MGFKLTIASIVFSLYVFDSIDGHGRLLVPPARSTMWKEGFDTPIEYTDNGNNCGGTANQWEVNDGQCGICGDPYNLPRPRPLEHGGKFGTGTIARVFEQGQDVEIQVDITAPHMGYFEFRICNMDDLEHETLECLNKNLLELDGENKLEYEGKTVRWEAGNDAITHKIMAKLPRGLTCDQCVLQWKWHTGNSWGTDEFGSGIGFGAQEEFYGCADIKIVGSGELDEADITTPKPRPTTTSSVILPPAEKFCKFVGNSSMFGKQGLAIGLEPFLDELCICACNDVSGYCPGSLCTCVTKCEQFGAYGSFARNASSHEWCDETCQRGQDFCPTDKCTCLIGGGGYNTSNVCVMICLAVVSLMYQWN